MSRDEAWVLDMLQAARQAVSYAQGLTEVDLPPLIASLQFLVPPPKP